MVSTTRNDLASGEPSAFAAPRRISIAGGSASRSPRTVFVGMVNVSCTPSPAWRPERSVIAVGIGGEGATGSPGAPQPARKNKRPKIEIVDRKSKRSRLVARGSFVSPDLRSSPLAHGKSLPVGQGDKPWCMSGRHGIRVGRAASFDGPFSSFVFERVSPYSPSYRM